MAENYVTKDQELAWKLQSEEGCLIIKTRTDPVDGVKEYTFEESESEVNKILGVKPEKVVEEKAEVLPESEFKKVKPGRPKKRRKK